MRLTILLTFVFLISKGFCQELYEEKLPINDKGKIDFSEVVEVKGTDKYELNARALQWFAANNSALKSGEKGSDNLSSEVINSIYIDLVNSASETKVHYRIALNLKKGKYVYSVTDIIFETEGNKYNGYKPYKAFAEEVIGDDYLYKKDGQIRPMVKQYKEKTLASIYGMVNDLKNFMQSQSTVSSN